jgi:hypothetical protein
MRQTNDCFHYKQELYPTIIYPTWQAHIGAFWLKCNQQHSAMSTANSKDIADHVSVPYQQTIINHRSRCNDSFCYRTILAFVMRSSSRTYFATKAILRFQTFTNKHESSINNILCWDCRTLWIYIRHSKVWKPKNVPNTSTIGKQEAWKRTAHVFKRPGGALVEFHVVNCMFVCWQI